MALKSDIVPYLTVDGYVSPSPVPPCTIRSCDNEPLFTSEYYMLLSRLNESEAGDFLKWAKLIHSCVGSDNYLHRAPGDTTLDSIDDHIGVIAACAEFKLGPTFKLPFALWRFPQLDYAYLVNKGIPSIVIFPLAFISGIIIGTSCMWTNPNNSTARILNYLIWQAVKRKSIFCNLMGMFWYWRQKKVYKTSTPMRSVYAIYFGVSHPLSVYMNE